MSMLSSPAFAAREPTFRTASLSQWRSTVSRQILPLETQTVRTDGFFRGRVYVAHFDGCLVADVRSSAHRVIRTRSTIANDEERHLKVIWQLGGKTQLDGVDGASVIDSGQWAVYDTSKPYTFHMSDRSHFQMLLIPVSRAAHWSGQVERMMGMALPGGGATEIARRAASSLFIDDMALDPGSQAVLQDSVLSLIGSAVSGLERSVAGDSGVSERLRRAKAFIKRNLADAALTPDYVANACGISKRSLYSDFKAAGLSPQAYITQCKIALACELMLESGRDYKTITEISYDLGFSDPAHFSRMFSRYQGITPSQWRARQSRAKLIELN